MGLTPWSPLGGLFHSSEPQVPKMHWGQRPLPIPVSPKQGVTGTGKLAGSGQGGKKGSGTGAGCCGTPQVHWEVPGLL